MSAQPRLHDVRRIARVRAERCITIYGDATSWLRGNHDSETAMAQIRSAVAGLEAIDTARELIETIRGRLTELAAARLIGIDRRLRSIAIFATENEVEVFALTSEPTPWVGVADRFLISPLLEGALSLVPPVFVLAISENVVRLIDVTTHPAELVEVPGIPVDLKSTIDLDLTNDRETLAHLRTSENPTERLREFARAIDHAVAPVLIVAGAVLVIAAAEPLASIYRAAASHGPVTNYTIIGNHDGDSPGDIANLAAPIIEQYRRAELEAHLAHFAEVPARGLVLTELEKIAGAAREGAIDTLFVDLNRRIPMPDVTDDGAATIDLVDEIVRSALRSDATIVPVRSDDLPTPDPVAAVLRYAMAGPGAHVH